MSVLKPAADQSPISAAALKDAAAALSRLVNPLRDALIAVARWRRQQRAQAELVQLDDRLLADIGISRSQIDAAIIGSLGTPRCARKETTTRGL